jgi:hypothetical protein
VAVKHKTQRLCAPRSTTGRWCGKLDSVVSDEDVERATSHYPPADITPAEFEQFVVELVSSASGQVDDLVVTLHDKVTGMDGTYDFDATVRFTFGGANFLVIVEAKRHRNPIKRELVQVLRDKMQGVGAQKAVMISTAPYQRGALEYARTHGIALATVTEGRFLYETKAITASPVMTRDEARERFGLPAFAAHGYGSGDEPGSTRVTFLSTESPEYVAEVLLGIQGQR